MLVSSEFLKFQWHLCCHLFFIKNNLYYLDECLVGAGATQRTGVQPGEMQGGPGLESPHSVRNLQVLQLTSSNNKSERRRIKWPAVNMTSLWNQFDNDVDQTLEATGKGKTDRKLQAMTTIIGSIAAERFGSPKLLTLRTTEGTGYTTSGRR